MLYTMSKWFFRLPEGLLLWLSGRPQMTTSDGRAFDPANQLFLVTALRQGILQLDDTQSVPDLRALWDRQLKPFEKPPLTGIRHRDLQVEVDQATIRVREYVPEGVSDDSPALVYLHGGGFTTFTIETYQAICEFLAKELNAKIYSVEYRLAPEHPYPVPLDDCCAAFEWVCSHAAELGLDPARISIGGDSAGGNLAAALCLKRRDTGLSLPKSQLLIYPTTDLTGSHPSVEEFAEGQIIGKAHIKWFHSNYVPDEARMKEPYASPLYADDHAGLPPAVLITAGFDVLRDEGVAYAKALSDAGVPVQHREFSSLGHAFMFADATAAVHKANEEICALFAKTMRTES